MMNDMDEKELMRLREAARPLRHEADSAAIERVRRGVAQRIASRTPSIFEILAAWFRPVAAVVAVALIVLAVVLFQQNSTDSTGLVAQAPPLAAEELYRDPQ